NARTKIAARNDAENGRASDARRGASPSGSDRQHDSSRELARGKTLTRSGADDLRRFGRETPVARSSSRGAEAPSRSPSFHPRVPNAPDPIARRAQFAPPPPAALARARRN